MMESMILEMLRFMKKIIFWTVFETFKAFPEGSLYSDNNAGTKVLLACWLSYGTPSSLFSYQTCFSISDSFFKEGLVFTLEVRVHLHKAF